MSSVGPQLPPHLSKRKRSPSEPEHPSSPPHKVVAASAPRTLGPTLPPSQNPDEVALDESSDDDYGPSASTSTSTKPTTAPRTVGPSLPPAQNPEELDLEGSSDDDYGPSIPTTKKPSPPPPKKRILGPAPPPATLSELPSQSADSDSSDDDYGPSLPPPPGSYAESQLLAQRQQSENHQRASAAAAEAAKPQRAEWMLVPPTDSDWTSRVDPTKLKNRKFASGKGAKAPAEKSGVSAIWTETPEEKRQRLEDEVLGRKDAASSNKGTGSNKGKGGESREERETAERIRLYNEKLRGRSLLDEHSGRAGEKEKEDDPSTRGFDREKDMALGGRLGNGEKREMLAKARDFGSRFERGKYL